MAKPNHPVDALMEQAVERAVFPAAALLVAYQEKILHQGYYGKARKGMCFDIASLTKPICTATLAMLLIQENKLKLTDTVYQWLGGARQPIHKKITVEHLLGHTSGLPAWKPYYRELPLEAIGKPSGKEHVLRAILAEPTSSPPGKQCEYSDLGFILLGEILEQAGGTPLDKLFDKKIAKPLSLKNTFFVPLTLTLSHQGRGDKNGTLSLDGRGKGEGGIHYRRFAPTEDCPWRSRVIHGEVHDQNCYAMGGAAGHAGLFATSSDIHRFVVALLKSYRGESNWIHQDIVKQFIDPDLRTHALTHLRTYLLGWDTPTFGSSSAGRYFSPHSIGHLGYTGCSFWLDLDKNFWVILLTNRIHPNTNNEKIKTFRPRLHNAVWREFMANSRIQLPKG